MRRMEDCIEETTEIDIHSFTSFVFKCYDYSKIKIDNTELEEVPRDRSSIEQISHSIEYRPRRFLK